MAEKSRRLPGIMPLDMADWLVRDDAHRGQMAERARLLHTHRDEVLQMTPEAHPSAQELLELVLAHLPQGYRHEDDRLHRPDGARVEIDADHPMETLARLVQEDFCILQKHADEHVLTGALLCFPASWRLSEKFARPLSIIHDPVAPYDADIAKRVQRLFDAVRPERPLWRANALRYSDPELYQPRSAAAPRDHANARGYIRSERQSILRLPRTDAIVFSIHTTVIPESALTQAQAAGLKTHPIIHA